MINQKEYIEIMSTLEYALNNCVDESGDTELHFNTIQKCIELLQNSKDRSWGYYLFSGTENLNPKKILTGPHDHREDAILDIELKYPDFKFVMYERLNIKNDENETF